MVTKKRINYKGAVQFRTTPVIMKPSQIVTSISVLRELNKNINFNNPIEISKLVSKEFDCDCTIENTIKALDEIKYSSHEDTDVSLIIKHCI